ncbi:MAG: hypothetical protein VKK42_07605 [Lyngbya sp.]|nr:hypothetical protein [Lyngbya sp.]
MLISASTETIQVKLQEADYTGNYSYQVNDSLMITRAKFLKLTVGSTWEQPQQPVPAFFTLAFTG